jgi:serine/threonine-protein phosphatase with EF-hand domain
VLALHSLTHTHHHHPHHHLHHHQQDTIGAVGLIQRWYRRKQAELELRRKCYWRVFTDIEYSSEQEQLGLNNFFADLGTLKEALQEQKQQSMKRRATQPDINKGRVVDQEAIKMSTLYATDDTSHAISPETEDKLFNRPNPPSNLTVAIMKDLIKGCQEGHVINIKLAMSILDESFTLQRTFPNIRAADTRTTHKMTVVGDLHGKLIDLLMIFEKNGLPSDQNPYIINGDFVDRGKNGTEICLILFGFQLIFPHSVFITRGNHEDYLMNKRYGFEQEVVTKYKVKASVLLRAFAAMFSALPLAVIINSKILVVHGGIGEGPDLAMLSRAKRQSYVSILRAAKNGMGPNNDAEECRQVVNALWSDPGRELGSTFNQTRGGGCIWGPDVTEAFMAKYKISLIVRSHECMPNGYGWTHDKKVFTVFSASSYYAPGSNLGAYIRFDSAALEPYIVQFDATSRVKHEREISLREQVGIVEKAAVKNILEKIFENKQEFERVFRSVDPTNSGKVSVGVWADQMAIVTKLNVPWRTMKASFVQVDEDGMVDYRSCLQSVHLDSQNAIHMDNDDAETLYSHLGTLEFIFRLIDTDASGSISKEEFCMALKTLNRYIGTEEVTDEEAHSMADAIDLDGDGRIDFNEFTESFRLVRDRKKGENDDNSDAISVIAEAGELHFD